VAYAHTAVLTISATLPILVGSTVQIIFGILVAVMYMKLYGYFAPMLEPVDDFLQELAQYQVFFTLFIALLLRTGEKSEERMSV
jgi:hypothetical protein